MQNVKIDREKYIGGSDISTIMGINPFKTRFDLLLEKAELKEDTFEGNEYTEYGNVLEPKIRDYINESEKKKFIEDKVIKEKFRYHSDGFNGECVLEVKATSQIKEKIEDYKVYLVQLVFGMQMHEVKKGKLAVYERPKDFDDVFNKDRLTIFNIDIKDYSELLEQINTAVAQFIVDLSKVKENPLITEEELQPKEVIEISNKVVALETALLEYENTIKERDKLKKQLKGAMEKYNIPKWTTPNGTQITLVAKGKDTISEVFDEEKFKEKEKKLFKEYSHEEKIIVLDIEKLEKEKEETYNKYAEEKITRKGKSSYLLITLPKLES